MTKGGRGSKNLKKLRDVIYVWPLCSPPSVPHSEFSFLFPHASTANAATGNPESVRFTWRLVRGCSRHLEEETKPLYTLHTENMVTLSIFCHARYTALSTKKLSTLCAPSLKVDPAVPRLFILTLPGSSCEPFCAVIEHRTSV